jgi:hypothetical protein
VSALVLVLVSSSASALVSVMALASSDLVLVWVLVVVHYARLGGQFYPNKVFCSFDSSSCGIRWLGIESDPAMSQR